MRVHHPGKTPAADQPGRTVTPAAGPHAAISRSAVGDVPGGRSQPLAAPVTEEMGSRLGGDFPHVPVYSSSAARAAAAEAGALVSTSGSHVVAGDGGADTHILALQHSIGNVAVSRMLQQAPRRHGAGSGHQRTAPPARVQSPAVHDVLASPGQPLPAPVQEEMEGRLGADFSRVRVHTDAAARASAADLGACAYTSGVHVVIGDGGADKHTLAHELTHVIQHRQGPAAGTDHGSGLKVSDPSDRDEKAAEVNAAQVMRAPLSRQRRAAAQASEQRAPIHFTQANPGSRTVARMLAPAPPQPTFQQVVSGSQVINLHEDEHAYAHYTYDVVNINGNLRRDNEHLTIENSLAALIAILGTDPEDVWAVALARVGKETTKSTYYELAQKRGYAGVDNFNFRSVDQRTRPLPTGGAPGDVTPKTDPAEPVDIEPGLSLRHFLDFIGRVFKALSADATAVITSIEAVTGQMGTTPDNLFLNSRQRSDFTTFTLMADRAARVHHARGRGKEPPEVPAKGPLAPSGPLAPLARLYQHPPHIRIEWVWFYTNEKACQQGLDTQVFQSVESGVHKEGQWERREGDPGFNEVRTFLVNKYWPEIQALVRPTP